MDVVINSLGSKVIEMTIQLWRAPVIKQGGKDR